MSPPRNNQRTIPLSMMPTLTHMESAVYSIDPTLPPNTQFREGDAVMIVEGLAGTPGFPRGKIYTIEHIDTGGRYPIHIRHSGFSGYVNALQIERVREVDSPYNSPHISHE